MTTREGGSPGTPRTFIRGVPHALPDGEQLLWEGAPTAAAVATHVFHWKLLVGYFAGMLLLWGVGTEHVVGSQAFLASLLMRLGASVLAMLIVFGLSRAIAATTWYAITSQRLVLRIGMVLPMSINLPFSLLESAGVATFKDGTGQVALRVAKGNRIAYIALWPHCRVFQLNNPEPVLRGLADPVQVGDILARAVSATSDASTRIERSSVSAPRQDPSSMPQPVGV